ncbi:hypothetical protein HK097_004882, partial [Rhizophlyctis rosea]
MPSQTRPSPGGSEPPLLYPDGNPYQWSETPESVTIQLVVPNNFQSPKKGGDHVIAFARDSLVVHIAGEKRERIKGKLFAPVNKEESTYEMNVDKLSKTGLHLLTITLTKSTPNKEWPILISATLSGGKVLDPSTDAEDIDPQSAFILGDVYLQAKNIHMAVGHYQKAASRDNVPALLKLAAWHMLGDSEPDSLVLGIPFKRDLEKAFEYHLKAAHLGHAEAAHHVGMVYLEKGNYAKAAEYFELAQKIMDSYNGKVVEKQLYASNAMRLGLMHADGDEGWKKPDIDAAIPYYAVAADLGNPDGTFALAACALNGWGMPQNIQFAVHMIRQTNELLPPHLKNPPRIPPQLEGLDLEVGMEVLAGVWNRFREELGLGPEQGMGLPFLVEQTHKFIAEMGGFEVVRKKLRDAEAANAADAAAAAAAAAESVNGSAVRRGGTSSTSAPKMKTATSSS